MMSQKHLKTLSLRIPRTNPHLEKYMNITCEINLSQENCKTSISFIACLGQEIPLGTQEFENLMAVDSEPVPDEVIDPSAVDTLPADLPSDFNLDIPSPSPTSPTLSTLDARILELQPS